MCVYSNYFIRSFSKYISEYYVLEINLLRKSFQVIPYYKSIRSLYQNVSHQKLLKIELQVNIFLRYDSKYRCRKIIKENTRRSLLVVESSSVLVERVK